jgi:aspartate aminotransferase
MKTFPVMSPFPVSENVSRMQSSATIAAMQAAQALRASGANVCDFGAGEPDFDTPDNIKQAAEKAIHAGRTSFINANSGSSINRAK